MLAGDCCLSNPDHGGATCARILGLRNKPTPSPGVERHAGIPSPISVACAAFQSER